MNKRRPNWQECEGCLGWQRRKTRLLWLVWPSTQRIGKDPRASSLFTRREADVISEAIFTMMTGDRDDELAAMDLSMIAVALTPSWLVLILSAMPVRLYFSSILFSSACGFFLTRNYIYYTRVSCVWFLLPYVILQSDRAWKPFKLGRSISFSLCGFSSLLML